MKVVVAGGSGFVGRHLVSALAAEQHDVVVLSRDPLRARARFPAGVATLAWDPTGTCLDWAPQLANSTAVVNLCGASIGRWPWTAARKRVLRSSRLEPTHALVDAIASLPPSERPAALLNASTVEIYDGADEEPATETTPPSHTPLARLVGDWEAAALCAEDLAIRVVLLRTGLVLAPHSPALRQLGLPFRLFVGGRMGSGEQWTSWIDVSDAIALILRAIRSWDLTGPINLVAPQPVRQREFAAALGRALGRPSRVRTPAWLLRLVFGDQATLLLGSRRAVPAKALAASYEFKTPQVAVALRRLVAHRPPRSTRAHAAPSRRPLS